MSSSINNNNAASAATEQQQQQDNSEMRLENLVRQLHTQIKASNWLETHTATKLEQENPELIKDWKEAIGGESK